jgi:hypothetical protein
MAKRRRARTGRKAGAGRKDEVGAGAETDSGAGGIEPGEAGTEKERVELLRVSGENVVDIEPAVLEQEADAIGATLGAIEPAQAAQDDAGQGGADAGPGGAQALDVDQAAAMAASYEAGAFILLRQASRIVAPNWNVTDAENRELAKATATALALWFPDQQLPPKYAALLALAGCVYGIAESRRDPQTGRIRPLRAPPADAESDPQRGFEFRAPQAGAGQAMFGSGAS